MTPADHVVEPEEERLVEATDEQRRRSVPEPDQVIEDDDADVEVSDPGGDSDPDPAG